MVFIGLAHEHGATDTEKVEFAIGIRLQVLSSLSDQISVLCASNIRRQWLQVEDQIARWHQAVIHNQLIDAPFSGELHAVAADDGGELVSTEVCGASRDAAGARREEAVAACVGLLARELSARDSGPNQEPNTRAQSSDFGT